MGNPAHAVLQKKRRVGYVLLALVVVGVLTRVVTFWRLDRHAICGADFPVFYAGGQLVGTADLYSPAAAQAIHKREVGCTSYASVFLRLPYFAALMWPLAKLPFWQAFALWNVATVGALVGFVWLWPAPRLWSALACAWSLPLAWNITNGQDVAFLLLWVAIGVTLIAKNRCFLAGLVLSLCAAKFHMFLLLPLLIAGQRLWKVGHGLVIGICVLLAASFALGGWQWPVRFLAAISDRRIDPTPLLLPNLRGLVHGALVWEVVLASLVAVVTWYVCRCAPFDRALCAVLVGSVLVSHHLSGADGAMFLPVALTLASQARFAWLRLLAVVPVLPTTWFVFAQPGLGQVASVVVLVLFCGIAYEVKTLASLAGGPRGAVPAGTRAAG